MATNNQIKFYKGASAPSTPAAGMIWFCTSDRTIRVYTGSDWEKYAGLVNAAWSDADQKLTITDAAGTVTELNLSGFASASAMAQQLAALDKKIDDTVAGLDAEVASADGSLVTVKVTEVDGKITAVNVTDSNVAAKDTMESEIARVEGLVTAEAARADAAEKANATAASNAMAKAEEGVTAAGEAAAAVETEKGRAEGAEQALSGRIDAMDAAYKAADEEILGQIEDIVAAAVSIKNADNDKYIEVSQDGTVYTVSSKGIDDAIAVETGRATAAESALGARIDALDSTAAESKGRVTLLEEQVAALNAATHFEGVVEGDTFEAAVAASGKTFESGDIVIYGNKEFIFDGENWIELGDTTAESGRISTLESWKTEASQAIADNAANIQANDGDIEALQNRAKALEDGMANYYTKSEVDGIKGTIDAAVAGNTTEIGKLQAADQGFETRIAANEGVIAGLDARFNAKADASDLNTLSGRVDATESEIDNLQAGSGLGTANAPVYTNANYISGAATMVAADMALDAKIKELEGELDAEVAKDYVATVTSGDAYAAVDNTDPKNPKVKVNVAGSVAEGNSGIITGGAVYDALCWVEFN